MLACGEVGLEALEEVQLASERDLYRITGGK